MSKKANITFENFDLVSIKVVNKSVDIRYFNLENPNRLEHPEGKDLPSEKLLDSLDALKEIFAEASGHLDGFKYAREVIPQGDFDNGKIALEKLNVEIENHSVSGVRFISGDKEGVQISGYRKITNGGGYGYSSPRIYFDAENISYGDKLYELSQEVKLRAYNYLFKGEFGVKKSKDEPDPNQTSLLDEDQQQE
jgi:hypothetical protein